MDMLQKLSISGLVIMLSSSHSINAEQVKPVTDMINPLSFQRLNQSPESIDADMQSCESDEIGVITIYATTGGAQLGIDVKIDGSPVGSLTTHFPDAGPECKTPSSEGVITLIVPAGKHMLEAESINLVWPAHTFRIDNCECLTLPLS